MPPVLHYGKKRNVRPGDLVMVNNGGVEVMAVVSDVEEGKSLCVRCTKSSTPYILLPWDSPLWSPDPLAKYRINEREKSKQAWKNVLQSNLGDPPDWSFTHLEREEYNRKKEKLKRKYFGLANNSKPNTTEKSFFPVYNIPDDKTLFNDSMRQHIVKKKSKKQNKTKKYLEIGNNFESYNDMFSISVDQVYNAPKVKRFEEGERCPPDLAEFLQSFVEGTLPPENGPTVTEESYHQLSTRPVRPSQNKKSNQQRKTKKSSEKGSVASISEVAPLETTSKTVFSTTDNAASTFFIPFDSFTHYQEDLEREREKMRNKQAEWDREQEKEHERQRKLLEKEKEREREREWEKEKQRKIAQDNGKNQRELSVDTSTSYCKIDNFDANSFVTPSQYQFQDDLFSVAMFNRPTSYSYESTKPFESQTINSLSSAFLY